MTSRALAWRTLTAEPARATLAVAGVAVIGALLFDMLLLSRGLLVSFRDLLDTAGYDVRVAMTDGLPALRMSIPDADALVAEIERLPEVQEVAIVRTEMAVAIAEGRAPRAMTLVSITGGVDRRAWRMVAGENLVPAERTPDRPPLVVGKALAAVLGLGPGSIVRVSVTPTGAPSALPAVTFRVAGIAEFAFEARDELAASTTTEAFRQARAGAVENEHEADVVLVASARQAGPDGAAAAIARLRPDLRAYTNEQIVAQFNRDGFAYFRQISVVLSSITLGFAFLLVATLLTVSVNQRLSEVAALRALGFRRRRIAATLLWESAWLVGTGGLLALPLGGALALALDRILRAMPGIPERLHFFVLEPQALVLHVILLVATAVGAAAYPVWVATHLPIAATLRREVVS